MGALANLLVVLFSHDLVEENHGLQNRNARVWECTVLPG